MLPTLPADAGTREQLGLVGSRHLPAVAGRLDQLRAGRGPTGGIGPFYNVKYGAAPA
jgi:hypothetical protein